MEGLPDASAAAFSAVAAAPAAATAAAAAGAADDATAWRRRACGHMALRMQPRRCCCAASEAPIDGAADTVAAEVEDSALRKGAGLRCMGATCDRSEERCCACALLAEVMLPVGMFVGAGEDDGRCCVVVEDVGVKRCGNQCLTLAGPARPHAQ